MPNRQPLIGFNSTLVQLKDRTGRIRVKCERSFNSTLVQLKATGNVNATGLIASFNSTLVQLKGLCLSDE